MPHEASSPVELEFSSKYDRKHAEQYLHKHRHGLQRRLSNLRDLQLARKALAVAGDPTLVLDLPCGAGRFWPVLAEHPQRVILAGDNSADMLAVATASQAPEIVARVRTLETSAFDIMLPDRSVDAIFCMRLLHHIGDPTHRLTMMKEFHRVTRDSVILSLWVGGNYQAWKRHRLEARRERTRRKAYQNRFVLSASQVEREFAEAGFTISGRLDFLPLISMWRVYVLRRSDA